MLFFHIQNGLYNSFFFDNDTPKTCLLFPTEEDYRANNGVNVTLEYNGINVGNMHKFTLFTSGYCLLVDGDLVLLEPVESKSLNPLGDILKEAIDVSEYTTSSSTSIVVPYINHYGFTLEVYDSLGNKVVPMSSSNGSPFLLKTTGYTSGEVENFRVDSPLRTSGVLSGIRTSTLYWSSNSFIKSNLPFSSSSNSLPWAFLSSLRPLYIFIKPNNPGFSSNFFIDIVFKGNDFDVYSKTYYRVW